MKILVDKMPEKGEDCLFNKLDKHHTGFNLCSLTNRTCMGKPVCHHLKEQKGQIYIGSSEFVSEKELKDVENTKIHPCLCGSERYQICKVGNTFAALYYIRCDACEHESEQFPSIKEAIDSWNDDVKVQAELEKGNMDIYTPQMYQELAATTADPKLSTEKALVEGLVGINSEAGEALDIWKKYEFHKHDLDKKAIALELGDTLWYLTEAAVALGYSLEDIMKMNIEKLEKRYPNGFDPERSKNREE